MLDPRNSLIWRIYIGAFYVFLFAPLIVVAVFAFNASSFPSLPWRGFTLDWFFASQAAGTTKPGIFQDPGMMRAIFNSVRVAIPVTIISLLIGTTNSFLLERYRFPGQTVLSVAMLWPLVIPGVILGTSILAFASGVAEILEGWLDMDIDFLRPSLPLVVIGQCSFTITIATLMVSARLRKLDRTLEEAALNLGANRFRVLRTITLPFLAPALVGGALVCFLLSVENFNTSLMLMGSEPTLPIYMYGQMRDGATPAINAVSVLLMSMTMLIAILSTLRKAK